MQTNDREYFRDRAAQESAAANSCHDVTARRVHLELAERYRALAAPADKTS
ncbi:hypothetical protein [Sphingomonas sp. IW22]|uniref:hypothetical protein n=1 Tax=Sphingomonas sp. IW22 TaxID=3242489 RepID=UPI003520F4F2